MESGMEPTEDTQSESQDFSNRKRARSAHLGQLTKLYNELEKCMSSYENIESVKLLYEKLCVRFEQFKSEHLICLDLCTEPETINGLKQGFDRSETNFVEFHDRYSQWMSGRNSPIPEDNDGCSDVSHVSSRTSSTLVSSKSKLRNAQAKRLLAEHKLKQLAKKHELQRAQKELELQQQLFEQQCELEEASLEESVWQHAVSEDANEFACHGEVHGNPVTQDARSSVRGRLRAVSDEMTSASPEPTPTSPVRLESPMKNDKGKSDVSVTSIDTAFQRLATTLQEGFNLPKPELLTFNGTPIDYSKFIRNFEANIENSVSDDKQRLSYLIQFCNGEAKSCIED